MTRRHTRMLVRLAPAGGILAVALVLGGCGDAKTRVSANRPPTPIVVGASISTDAINVSPRRFGAGPVHLVITNQTQAAQQITFESAGGGGGFTQSTGPINPSGTATLTADVPPGKAVVKVAGNGIRAATVHVGQQRASAQNELLQP
jgi:hypothetical protein